MNCCGHCACLVDASCRQGKAANDEQDDLSLLVPETPCCVVCRAKVGASTRARSSMWGKVNLHAEQKAFLNAQS